MPKVDNTDFYMFRSYGTDVPATDKRVTVLANYQPLQDAYGGPNYFSMDPEALYEIHFDTDGNGEEDLTLQFRFKQKLNSADGNGVTLNIGPADAGVPVAIPFINANLGDPSGPAINFANQNTYRHVLETYTVNVIRGNRRTGESAAVTHDGGNAEFVKPLDYIGTKSLGNAAAYAAYSDAHVTTATLPPGTGACAAGGQIRVFAGQRQEGFAVLLGNIFDLVNATATQLTDSAGGTAANPIGNKNVTTLAVELPVDCLASTAQPIVGGWATASVRQARVINPDANYTTPAKNGGAWAQVSRLGSPLVNEVVIGLKDKDKFNSSEPKNDGTNFATYITNPTLPHILAALFGSASVVEPKVFPRTDLVAAFATGIPNVNQVAGSSAVAEMIRLNTSFDGRAAALQNRLGAAQCFVADDGVDKPKKLDASALNLNCDPTGFPNGRRPGDDVVDIALRVMMGYLLGSGASTVAPNADTALGDFVPVHASDFQSKFPYLNAPNPGATGTVAGN